jgi:hypothetical protein
VDGWAVDRDCTHSDQKPVVIVTGAAAEKPQHTGKKKERRNMA